MCDPSTPEPPQQTLLDEIAAHIADDLHDEFHTDFDGFEYGDGLLAGVAEYAARSVASYALKVDPDLPLSVFRERLRRGALIERCSYVNHEIADCGDYESMVRCIGDDGIPFAGYTAADLVAWLRQENDRG